MKDFDTPYEPNRATIQAAKSFVTMVTELSFWQSVRSAPAAIIRRPMAACVVFTGSTLAGVGIVVAASGLVGGAPAVAERNAVYMPDVDSLLDGRSPGSRRYGWLLDTKPGQGPVDPVERVLSSVRRGPGVAGVPGDLLPVGAPIIPFALVLAPDIPASVVPDLGNSGAFVGTGAPGGIPAVGGILPGGGGGGGSSDGGNDSDAPVLTTPSSPVPELTTWVMLILGFLLVGTGIRRRGVALAIPQ